MELGRTAWDLGTTKPASLFLKLLSVGDQCSNVTTGFSLRNCVIGVWCKLSKHNETPINKDNEMNGYKNSKDIVYIVYNVIFVNFSPLYCCSMLSARRVLYQRHRRGRWLSELPGLWTRLVNSLKQNMCIKYVIIKFCFRMLILNVCALIWGGSREVLSEQTPGPGHYREIVGFCR